ncbi:hypothetical protein LPB136_09635 [Tenacibaculum todarodis]|uniref:HNH endonuclease 5 domain-containing protein n=1 Tax=Tenacibaculum todarodis TaxID=1850252 RepID=A0A1L3JKF8_9FLAO|nr:HNH endonuclease [Tenacibaculum todarodis]APG65608.1 hypothetical protein LPB136_09635 [Tenacibaculum todarodis]
MKKCLWCFKNENETLFIKKAHTIPKSLGGQNYNQNVCDECNEYFGTKHENIYSIEEALKEGFNITRYRILLSSPNKRKTGGFKSRFFEIKERKGKKSVRYNNSFKFNSNFQKELCRSFKRGLYKMFFEELNRQKNIGYEDNFNFIRNFARYNKGDIPVFYFNRLYGIFMLTENEAATPFLLFDRMKYLFSNKKFQEIEFLGHVFGFPISSYDENEFKEYIEKSLKEKTTFFKDITLIKKFTDIDFIHSIMNK